jgi:hypothetical protein
MSTDGENPGFNTALEKANETKKIDRDVNEY